MSRSARYSILLGLMCVSCTGCAWRHAFKKPRLDTKFIRIDDESIETAVCTYERGAQRVYVVNMIHYGEAPYYQKVAEKLEEVDAVYFELVYSKLITSPGSVLNLPYTALEIAFGHMKNWSFCRQTRLVRQIDFLVPESDWIHADVTMEQLIEKRFGSEYARLGAQVLHTPAWALAIALYPVVVTLEYADERLTTLLTSQQHYAMLRRRRLAAGLSAWKAPRKGKLYELIVTWRSPPRQQPC